jgi:perosamine synthetase
MAVSSWRTSFGDAEIQRVTNSIQHQCVSQGSVTKEFEESLAKILGVGHAICVTSGSAALMASLIALGLGPGDEVILPNRTWIATAHAAHLLGATVVLVDVEKDRPIIDTSKIEALITPRTRGIIPVHLNGRSSNMREIQSLASKHSLWIVEDAAQAMGSRNSDGFLGTQSDIGCFSLSVGKIISSGQGGFAVTNDAGLAQRLRNIRTHGVEDVKNPKGWVVPGFNFRFTDVLASIGIEQLKMLPIRIQKLQDIYEIYEKKLTNTEFELIPVNVMGGEVPVYNEFLVRERSHWITYLETCGIDTRPFYPDVAYAEYIRGNPQDYPNSTKYGQQGLFLPSGPGQEIADINRTVEAIVAHL